MVCRQKWGSSYEGCYLDFHDKFHGMCDGRVISSLSGMADRFGSRADGQATAWERHQASALTRKFSCHRNARASRWGWIGAGGKLGAAASRASWDPTWSTCRHHL